MLNAQWGQILRNPKSRKVIIVTLAFGRNIEKVSKLPLMRIPGTVRASTHPDTVIAIEGEKYPYWPNIVNWPEVTTSFNPVDRRADISSTTVILNKDSGVPIDELGVGGTPTGFGEICLWSDGISGVDIIPLLRGPIVGSSFDRDKGTISISLADGDVKRKVEFPPGNFKIDRNEFPDAPDYVAGYAPRSTIFGPFPDQIPCYQIDADAKEFYICEPALSVGPVKVYIGGEDVQSPKSTAKFPAHRVGVLSNNQTYSKLVFEKSIKDTNILGQVTCSGGVGLSVEHPALTLLRYGEYEVSPEAQAMLKRLPLNFFVFINNSADVIELVRDRLLPQTDLIGAFHLNTFTTFKIGGPVPQIKLAPGSGLLFRDIQKDIETEEDNIFNAIEVKFKRDLFSDNLTTRTSYIIDKSHGDHDVRQLLAISEQIYGRRYLSIEAPDLVQYLDTTESSVPRNVINLAEVAAKQHALIHNEWTYLANWYEGLALDLNWQVFLSDTDLRLTDRATRVISRRISPVGPWITLQSEIE